MKRECVPVEEPEPEGWIQEMIDDIDAHFKKNPDVPIFKTVIIGGGGET